MFFPPPQGPGVSDERFVKREVDLAFSKEEAAVNDALLKAMSAPREMYRQSAAPMTPRHGFAKQEPGIYEVLDTKRYAGPDRRMDYSGSYGKYSGTSRPGLGML